MSRIQKIEWISCIILILSFIMAMFVLMKNLDLFGTGETNPFEIISIMAMIASAVFYLAVYITRTVKVFLNKTEEKTVRMTWAIGPVVIAIGTALLVNGVNSFSPAFKFLNILSGIGVILMVAVYNVFFFMYYGRRKMYVSLVLYNIAAIALSWGHIYFIHNYYLMALIPAIVVGYTELFIKNKITAK